MFTSSIRLEVPQEKAGIFYNTVSVSSETTTFIIEAVTVMVGKAIGAYCVPGTPLSILSILVHFLLTATP